MDICECLPLPLEIIEMIFTYMPLEDLLNASLVSKTWLQTIGSSEALKKKSVINICQWNWDRNRITELIKSQRDYEILKVRLFESKDKNKPVLQKLLEKNWRKVFFNVSKVTNQKTFTAFINSLQSVRELQVVNVQIRELRKHDKIVLKQLESLAFSEVAVDTFYTFMAHQPALKKLSLRFISSDILSKERSGQVITSFLKLNQGIRELELNEDVTNDLFLTDITQQVKLCLKTLAIGLYNSNDEVQNNVATFLKSQESSLEQLEVIFKQKFEIQSNTNWWMVEDDVVGGDNERSNDLIILFNSWNSLIGLKELSLCFMSDRSMGIDVAPSSYKNLKPNYSINSLYFRHIACPQMQIKHILTIMSLCPNVKTLYISSLTPAVMRSAAFNLRLLRKMSYMSEIENALSVYAELKNTNEENINKFISFSVDYRG